MAWFRVQVEHAAGRALADRHYPPRRRKGARGFLAPGHRLLLVTPLGEATWGVVENNWRGELRWRVSIFRNEAPARYLSSDLVREGTQRTRRFWRDNYGGEPAAPLRTEVDPRRVRSTNPGYCFIKAGWRVVARDVGKRRLVVLEAPVEG